MSGSSPCSAIASRFRWCTPTTSKAEAVFSPDGRWIAYTTDDSGQPNVFVQPFPEAGEKLSGVDGRRERTRCGDRTARSCITSASDSTLMAVPIDTTGRVRCRHAAGALSHGVFNTGFNTGQTASLGQTYAVSKDGQRFLVNARTPQSGSVPPLNVVVNWMAAIQR